MNLVTVLANAGERLHLSPTCLCCVLTYRKDETSMGVETVSLWPQGSMGITLTTYMEIPRGASSLGPQHTPSDSGNTRNTPVKRVVSKHAALRRCYPKRTKGASGRTEMTSVCVTLGVSSGGGLALNFHLKPRT